MGFFSAEYHARLKIGMRDHGKPVGRKCLQWLTLEVLQGVKGERLIPLGSKHHQAVARGQWGNSLEDHLTGGPSILHPCDPGGTTTGLPDGFADG
jgi:hypothetical protein